MESDGRGAEDESSVEEGCKEEESSVEEGSIDEDCSMEEGLIEEEGDDDKSTDKDDDKAIDDEKELTASELIADGEESIVECGMMAKLLRKEIIAIDGILLADKTSSDEIVLERPTERPAFITEEAKSELLEMVGEDAELAAFEEGGGRAIAESAESVILVDDERLNVELDVPCSSSAASSLSKMKFNNVWLAEGADIVSLPSDTDGVNSNGNPIFHSADDEDGVASNGGPISHSLDEDDGVACNGNPISHCMVAVLDAAGRELPNGRPMNQLLVTELDDGKANGGFARASFGSIVDVVAIVICTGSSITVSGPELLAELEDVKPDSGAAKDSLGS